MNKIYWKNSLHHYGWMSIVLHWFMAVVIIGMYFLGDYMVELDYYDPWYHKGPALHKSMGILLVALLIFRSIWTYSQTQPEPLGGKDGLNKFAKAAHASLYLLILLLLISGYLISTAKGQGINVFDWFELPAILPDSADRGEQSGKIHAILGTVLIFMIALHTVAALVHHFIFKDHTLKRMLWANNVTSNQQPKRN